MGRIPRHVVDAVREHTDLVALVSRYVALKRRGANHVGLCPFHQEKTPSFNVSPDRDMFRCFGCNTYGDCFKFLMLIDGLSFVEAVKELAGAAGIQVEERDLTADEKRNLRKRATLFDVLEEACAFYESTLWTTSEGAPGRAYLDGRGLGRDTARAARVGYAADGWTRLVDHLHRKGFAAELVHEAGLVRERKNGPGYYDVFRGRILFPIHDERGRVVAFGGRLLEGDAPKYINTPETRLYHKSKVLYGFDTARPFIQRSDRALLVEGYFDVLALRQAGFPAAVATCGTALTAAHLEKLRRLTRNVLILTDADEAGQQAAERSLPLFLDAQVQPWRIELPDAKDPDELIQTAGPEAMRRALDRREPLVEWVVQRKLSAYSRKTEIGDDIDAMTRERALNELLPMLSRLPDVLTSRVAARLGVRETVLRARIAAHPGARTGASGAPASEAGSGWKPHVDVVHLLWLLVHHRDHVADLVERAGPVVLESHPTVLPTVARLLGGEPVAAVQHDTDDPGIARALAAVAARATLYTEEEAPLALCHVLDRLDKPNRRAALARLAETVDRALQAGEMASFREAAAQRAERITLERDLERSLSDGDVAAYAARVAASRHAAPS